MARKKNVSKTAKTETETAQKEGNVTETETETKLTPKQKREKEQQEELAKFHEVMDSIRIPSHNYPERIPATPDLPFDQVLGYTPLDTLLADANVRSKREDRENARDLAAKILRDGLLTALTVNVNPELGLSFETPKRLKGMGRAGALAMIRESHPSEFERVFPGGLIPVYGIECSAKEAASIIADHGDHRPIGSDLGLRKSFWLLISQGYSKRDAILRLRSTFARMSERVKSGKSDSWKKALEYRRFAELTKDEDERRDLLKKAEQAEHDTFYGRAQDMEREFQTPFVMDSILYTRDGVRPEQGPLSGDAYIPSLTISEVKALYKAFLADREADPKQVTFDSPGTMFWNEWNKICERKQKKGKKGATKSRSKSSTDLQNEAKKVNMTRGLQAVLNWAANTGDSDERDTNQAAMVEVNAALRIVEHAQLHLPEEWAELKARVEADIAERQKTAQAAAAEAAKQTA